MLINVVGVTFRPGYPDNILALGERCNEGKFPKITLEREPENPHDPRAIKIMVDGEHFGYVAKAENEQLAANLDAGAKYKCSVEEVRVSDKNPRKPGFSIRAVRLVKKKKETT